MDKNTDILHEAKRLRVLAAALELQHYTSTAANVVPIPGGDQVIAIGTPAHIALGLEIGPVPAELIRLGAIMASTLYNLKQHPGTQLDERTCGLLGELQQKWDTARREYREAAQQQLVDLAQELGGYDVASAAEKGGA
jgi:hypothetical protein